jgi:hypothetical protein
LITEVAKEKKRGDALLRFCVLLIDLISEVAKEKETGALNRAVSQSRGG